MLVEKRKKLTTLSKNAQIRRTSEIYAKYLNRSDLAPRTINHGRGVPRICSLARGKTSRARDERIAVFPRVRHNFLGGGSNSRHARERNEENARSRTMRGAITNRRGNSSFPAGLCGRPIVVAAGFQLKAIVTQQRRIESRISHYGGAFYQNETVEKSARARN